MLILSLRRAAFLAISTIAIVACDDDTNNDALDSSDNRAVSELNSFNETFGGIQQMTAVEYEQFEANVHDVLDVYRAEASNNVTNRSHSNGMAAVRSYLEDNGIDFSAFDAEYPTPESRADHLTVIDNEVSDARLADPQGALLKQLGQHLEGVSSMSGLDQAIELFNEDVFASGLSVEDQSSLLGFGKITKTMLVGVYEPELLEGRARLSWGCTGAVVGKGLAFGGLAVATGGASLILAVASYNVACMGLVACG